MPPRHTRAPGCVGQQVSGKVTDNRIEGENDGLSRLGESEKGTRQTDVGSI